MNNQFIASQMTKTSKVKLNITFHNHDKWNAKVKLKVSDTVLRNCSKIVQREKIY